MIYFFCGKDTYTLKEELEALKKEFLATNPKAWIEQIQIAPDVSPEELFLRAKEALESFGLFAKEKFLILEDFLDSGFAKIDAFLLDFLDKPPAARITLVFVQKQEFEKRSKLFKRLQKVAKISEFNIPGGQELQKWINQFVENERVKMAKDAVASLVTSLGEDATLWQAKNELEKLILYQSPSRGKAEDNVITTATVRRLVKPNFSQDVFDLTNAVAEKRATDAVSYLELLVRSVSAQEQKKQIIQIIGALASQIHSLLLIKEVEREQPEIIAKILGWKPGRVWINLKLAKKFAKEKLASMLLDLRAIDLRLKTSEEPPKLLLSLFIQKTST